MDDEMISELRGADFAEERRGYSKSEVRGFLEEVADWIEGGGGDTVRRRLERIAHKSASMLADAEAGAEGLRVEAEAEAREQVEDARAEADACREEAEAEARVLLRDARAEATATREGADEEAREAVEEAERRAAEIVATAERRRASIETVIGDLDAQRETTVAEVKKLSAALAATVADSRGPGAEVERIDEARKQRSEERLAAK